MPGWGAQASNFAREHRRDLHERKRIQEWHNNRLSGGGNMRTDGWAFPLNVFTGNLFGFDFGVQVEALNVISNVKQFVNGKPSEIIIDGNNKTMEELKKYFDFKLLRILYDDYKKMSDEEIMKHYAEQGKNEKRIIMVKCDWFDPKIYKYLNDDLIHLSDDEALKHFIFQGYNEDRPTNLPLNFNPVHYYIINSDIHGKCRTENEVKYHYASIGRKENRNYILNNDNMLNKNYLNQNEFLLKGQYIESENKRYKLIFQGDGNLVLYDGVEPYWKAIWSSGTCGKDATHFYFQYDNNCVIYNYSNPVWSSFVININKKCKLFVENDGFIRIRDNDNCTITENFSKFTLEGASKLASLLGFK